MSNKAEQLERVQEFLLLESIKQTALLRALLTQLEFHGLVNMEVIEDLAEEFREQITSELIEGQEEDDEKCDNAESHWNLRDGFDRS